MSESDARTDGAGAIGRVLEDRYEIVSIVGRGGMAAAYLALDRRMGRKVVVKIPHPEFLAVEGFRERFALEIRSLTSLNHPHIVQILDAGEAAGWPYAVLQYLPGGSLRERLDEAGGPLQAVDLEDWFEPVAATLDFIHSQGIIHRDLTPANILFDTAGHVFLTDFGIAKALEGTSTHQTLTRTGIAPGSVPYMAPEAIEGGAGPSYDQYALAVIVYRALTGGLPFDGATPVAVLVNKVTRQPRPMTEFIADINRDLADVVLRALSSEPGDRFESCMAFHDAVRASRTGRTRRIDRPSAAPAAPDPLPDTQDRTQTITVGDQTSSSRARRPTRRFFWVPNPAETEFARRAVERADCSSQEALLALDLQEKRCELGDRVGLDETLRAQGFVGYKSEAEIRRQAEEEERLESDRLFGESVVALGLLTEKALRAARLGRKKRRDGSVPLLSEILVEAGVLSEEDSVRAYFGQLRQKYTVEDEVFASVATTAGYIEPAAVEVARKRQAEHLAQGLPPLPIHSILMGMGLIDKERSDAIKRAIRRARITGMPADDFLIEVETQADS